MSEIDVEGHVLKSFTDVGWPEHLAIDNSSGQVIVAAFYNQSVFLLNSQLQLERVLIDNKTSEVKSWWPARLHYHQHSSRLYVKHSTGELWSDGEIISQWILE